MLSPHMIKYGLFLPVLPSSSIGFWSLLSMLRLLNFLVTKLYSRLFAYCLPVGNVSFVN